jgi:Zn-finger nucleic acid-binding protein
LFPCGKWLDVKEDDRKIERELYPQNRDLSSERSPSNDKMNRDDSSERLNGKNNFLKLKISLKYLILIKQLDQRNLLLMFLHQT